MDTDVAHTAQPSRPPSPSSSTLQPTNTLAGPSTNPDQPPLPPIFLPPPPGYPLPRPYFDSTQDLLRTFKLSHAYDKYVRPYSLPVDAPPPATPGAADKGKGKEKEVPAFSSASPAADTPGAGDEGEGDEAQGKTGKKWKNNYKHLIKGIPGKHHTAKKDDYLMTLMQVPPKQRIAIKPFDLRTQREAFSVSLEGITKWNVSNLIGDSPQAKEEKRRKRELRKLAKSGIAIPPGVGTPAAPGQVATPAPSATAGTPSTWAPAPAPVRTGTPRPVPSTRTSLPHPAHLANTSQQDHAQSVAAQRPAAVSSASYPPPNPPAQLPATPAPTPGAASHTEPKRNLKREREESATPQMESGMTPRAVSVSTNGPTRPLNGKAAPGLKPRPVKKQRVDMQGHGREMAIQQPTPHA